MLVGGSRDSPSSPMATTHWALGAWARPAPAQPASPTAPIAIAAAHRCQTRMPGLLARALV